MYLLRSWENDERLTRTRATGRAVAVVDWTLVWIFLPNGCAVTVVLMATVIVSWPPSARVYIWRRWGCFWWRQNITHDKHSQTRCIQPISRLTFCEHREWESRPPKSPSAERHLHGCAGDQVFGERTRACSLRPLDQHWSSSSSPAPFEGLHCVHLPASTTYDYIEHTHEMASVNGATEPWASVPPQGTICSLYLCIFYCCLLLTWVVIHICTYISSHTSLWFSGLN